MSAPTLSGPVCSRCSFGFGRDRVQVRHGSVADVRVCSGPAPVLPVVDEVAVFVAPAPPVLPRIVIDEIVAGSVWVLASGALCRVRASRSSKRLLASELVGSDEAGTWEYRGLASRFLVGAVPASRERVALFGHRAGACVFCSRRLDDERSLAAGYGPVCASKFDLPWG